MTESIRKCNPYPLGAYKEADGIRFAYAVRSFSTKEKPCGIILYDRETGKQLCRTAFSEQERIGNVYCKYMEGVDAAGIAYQFYEGEERKPDPYARAFLCDKPYGSLRESSELLAVLPQEDFDWEGDMPPKLSYAESIGYCMHVRGFTIHPSSRVKHKGTYRGIIEKIPYLKKTGITTLELQPSYEFLELTSKTGFPDSYQKIQEPKCNYWGYKKGYYYAPKAAYCAGKDVVSEYRELVRELHKNKMELIMQFYFPKEVPVTEIPEILRFWVLQYHIDGFHLKGENLPVELFAADALLSETKLWYERINTDSVYSREDNPAFLPLAYYQNDYLYTVRRYLKGDENMLEGLLYQMRWIPERAGRVHYLTNYDGFTLMDMVSYDHKHNEANGEENRDGSDYNCSWNCGEEGKSRKLKVRKLRQKQMKNAMTLLLCTQSMPLIFMGDEFGNSQQGNNNPYCQDNEVTWLDWHDLQKHQELYRFWVQTVNFRRQHPVLRRDTMAMCMDAISCGYPDISYHGESAWKPRMDSNIHPIGVLYCGKYAVKEDGTEDDFLYVAMNMHWEKHKLALPKLPKGMVWRTAFATAEELPAIEDTFQELPERSIAVYVSETIPNKAGRAENKKEKQTAERQE